MTPTPTQALEPCPHDGHEAKFERQQFDHPPKHWVKCTFCGASTDAYSSPDSARRAWNQRHRQSSNAASVNPAQIGLIYGAAIAAVDHASAPHAASVGVGVVRKLEQIAEDFEDVPSSPRAYFDIAVVQRDLARAALASLSTPTAEPMGEQFAENAKCSGDALREALAGEITRKIARVHPSHHASTIPVTIKVSRTYAEMQELVAALSATPPVQEGEGGKLRKAAQTVFEGLNARIDDAQRKGQPVPVFAGIADLHAALSTPAPTVDEAERLREALERTMTDPQRLLWRDDVEGICPTPGVCWEYGETARCGPCAIKQAEARGVVSDMSVPNLPEVYRLRREIASRTLPDGEALANELDAFVLVRTNDPALAIEVGDKVRAALSDRPQDEGEVK